MWDPQWSLLIDAGYRVVRCDFRGHGQSPAPTEPFNAADDVRVLLDSLGIGRAAIIGSSYGGRVAQEIAARWPERVSALVLWQRCWVRRPRRRPVTRRGGCGC
jgi:pimeloyl-ACP methyl ester carboxylesterase